MSKRNKYTANSETNSSDEFEEPLPNDKKQKSSRALQKNCNSIKRKMKSLC